MISLSTTELSTPFLASGFCLSVTLIFLWLVPSTMISVNGHHSASMSLLCDLFSMTNFQLFTRLEWWICWYLINIEKPKLGKFPMSGYPTPLVNLMMGAITTVPILWLINHDLNSIVACKLFKESFLIWYINAEAVHVFITEYRHPMNSSMMYVPAKRQEIWFFLFLYHQKNTMFFKW